VPAIRVPGVKPAPGIVPLNVPAVEPLYVPLVPLVPKPVPSTKPPAPGVVPRVPLVPLVPLHVPLVPFVPLHVPGIKPPAPQYAPGEIVQINLPKYCAVELLNALIVALGIVPPGKKKKGKKP
jgi:hypothetical protein